MWNEIKRLFVRRITSREEAKGRLHLVLAHDRSGLDGGKLQDLRTEIAQVLAKYVEIDVNSIEIEIERLNRTQTQLVVSSPLRAR
ncbi:MAG TPA: cell division topological specificity factor MinE [Polyangia bacterium]|nr:cell division topological specificity factor MinE [Polyangia bacterium]